VTTPVDVDAAGDEKSRRKVGEDLDRLEAVVVRSGCAIAYGVLKIPATGAQ
jgi:hypothetical protein